MLFCVSSSSRLPLSFYYFPAQLISADHIRCACVVVYLQFPMALCSVMMLRRRFRFVSIWVARHICCCVFVQSVCCCTALRLDLYGGAPALRCIVPRLFESRWVLHVETVLPGSVLRCRLRCAVMLFFLLMNLATLRFSFSWGSPCVVSRHVVFRCCRRCVPHPTRLMAHISALGISVGL